MTDTAQLIKSESLYIGLKAGKNYGWGVCSDYLTKELSKLIPVQILDDSDAAGTQTDVPGTLFQALRNVHLFPLFEKVRGTKNFGYTFFENELSQYSVENAKRFDSILAGSTWCKDRLAEKGIANSDVLIQGVDPNKFYPIRQRKPSRNFVIFSGGKFELRKGQDLVLRAVKILQEKYDDIILVNCWYNLWPQSIQLMASSAHIRLPDRNVKPWQQFMNALCELNGLKTDTVKTYELLPNYMLRSIYQGTDIGIFPNRCEGGTNLVLMEYMACAKPVIASNTSGHRDIITDQNAICLNDMRDISILDSTKRLIGRWQEPSLDELIDKIEYAYHNRDEIRRIGERAGEDLKNFTWGKSASSLLDIIDGQKLMPEDGQISLFKSNENPGQQQIKSNAGPRCLNKKLDLPAIDTAVCLKIGEKYRAAGHTDEALMWFYKTLDTDPNCAEAHFKLGVIKNDSGQLKKAEVLYRKALQHNPSLADAWNHLGLIAKSRQNDSEALRCFQMAIEIRPDMADALFNLAVVHGDTGAWNTAIHYYQRILKIAPDSAETLYNLAGLIAKDGRFDEAIRLLQKALRIKPDHADAYNNLGLNLKALGKLDQAILLYRKAIAIDPALAHAHLNLALALLLAGEFSGGWSEYDWRFDVDAYNADYRYRDRNMWDGKPFKDKCLLVHDDQGLGDTLQFVRYLPLVKNLGGTVILETRREIIPLLAEFPGIDMLAERPPEGQSNVEFDYYIPLMSIPGRMGTTLDSIPAKIPYLYAQAEKSDFWKEKMKRGAVKIGLIWAGNKLHINDANRSCSLDRFNWLQDISNISIFSLQKTVSPAEETRLKKMRAENFGPDFKDFSDTAAVIGDLDMVITVDTAVAHLAGAMGKTTWILLPFDPDWRWMTERLDSPWYPTVRLYRQRQPGDWDGVMSTVCRALKDRVLFG